MPLVLIPILEWIGIVSAGIFFTSGCAGSKKEVATPLTPASPPPPPDPVLDFTEKDNAPAYRLFRDITAAEPRLPLRLFDQGYQVVNFGYQFPEGGTYCGDPKAPLCVKGREDGKISQEEVWDFALAHLEKYYDALKKILGHPVPWLLDDFDPKTSFDEEKRKQISEAIQFLNTLLKKQGLSPDSPDYQEKLAVGLYFFTAMPDPEEMKIKREKVERLTSTLDAMNLSEWKNYLWSKGGLRVGSTEDKKESELSILEAMQQDKGACTELSKILYAVLKMAGQTPLFVNVNPWKTEMQEMEGLLNNNPLYGHVCIGLRMGKNILLLDPAIVQVRPHHGEYYLLSLRHYLSLDTLNHSHMDLQHGALEKGLATLDLAKSIDPQSYNVIFASGVVHVRKGEFAKAMEDYSQAIKINPYYAPAYLMRGQLYSEENEWSRSIIDFNRAIQLNPKMADAYYGRGLNWFQQMEFDKAAQDFTRAIEISPMVPLYYKQRGKVYANLAKYDEALIDFKKVLELNPEELEVPLLMGTVYNGKLEADEAQKFINEFIQKNPKEPEGFDQRGLSWGIKNHWDKALEDFDHAMSLRNEVVPHHLLHRGIAQLQIGNLDKARNDFVTLLKIFPEMEIDLISGLETTFEYQWRKNPKGLVWKKSLEADTDLNISRARTHTILAGVKWEMEKQDKALEKFQTILDIPLQNKPALSPRARKFLLELFDYLPDSMRKTPELEALLRKLAPHPAKPHHPNPNSLSLR